MRFDKRIEGKKSRGTNLKARVVMDVFLLGMERTAASGRTIYVDYDGIVGQSGTGDGEFNGPSGIAVDWSGYIYVTDSGNNRVQVFKPDGQFDSKWGESGAGDGQLDNPTGFCLFGSSEIYLTDTDNHRIQNLSAKSGYFCSKVGEYGMHSGQFDNPRGICYDTDLDQIIVADMINNRIQIFQWNNFNEFISSEITYIDQINEIVGLDPSGLSNPMAVAHKSSDTSQILFIADTGNNRIVKLEVEKERPGRSPLHIFELFKAAIRVGDIDKASKLFIEPRVDDYAAILEGLTDHLQDMVNNMGEMSIYMIDGGIAVYEYSNIAGTKLYPVIFSLDEDGNWKISKF